MAVKRRRSPPKSRCKNSSAIDQAILLHWLHEHAGRVPHWQFPEWINGAGLRLLRLTPQNYGVLYELFADDDHPYVEERFRDKAGLYDYVAQLMAVFPYQPQHGGADYLVYEEQTPVGIVHLYDLSVETPERAFVGFQIAAPWRGSDVAHRAVSTLETYALTERGLTDLRAETYASNRHAQAFLLRRGYVEIGGHRDVLTYQRSGQ